MLLARGLVLLLLLAGLVCLGTSLLNGNLRLRRAGVALIKWTVIAGLVFFGVLIVERVLEMSVKGR
ncbi:MAG: hypothetical protein M3O01_04030 [Pseudomonadota bacterium]|nr:hypothetical protein [Pseudomonadota bacterium]